MFISFVKVTAVVGGGREWRRALVKSHWRAIKQVQQCELIKNLPRENMNMDLGGGAV